MPSQRVSNLRNAYKQRRTPLLTGSLGAALAVAVVVGLARTQPVPQRQGRGAAPAARAATVAVSSATAAAIGRAGGPTTVYLVRTPEEEQTLRAWLSQGSFGVPGGAPATATVILAPSAAEVGFARGAVLTELSVAGGAPAVVDAGTILRP